MGIQLWQNPSIYPTSFHYTLYNWTFLTLHFSTHLSAAVITGMTLRQTLVSSREICKRKAVLSRKHWREKHKAQYTAYGILAETKTQKYGRRWKREVKQVEQALEKSQRSDIMMRHGVCLRPREESRLLLRRGRTWRKVAIVNRDGVDSSTDKPHILGDDRMRRLSWGMLGNWRKDKKHDAKGAARRKWRYMGRWVRAAARDKRHKRGGRKGAVMRKNRRLQQEGKRQTFLEKERERAHRELLASSCWWKLWECKKEGTGWMLEL